MRLTEVVKKVLTLPYQVTFKSSTGRRTTLPFPKGAVAEYSVRHEAGVGVKLTLTKRVGPKEKMTAILMFDTEQEARAAGFAI